MATMSPSIGEPVVPTAEDVAIAKEASHMLAAHLKHLSGVRFQTLEDRNRAEKLTLPPVAVRPLLDIMTEMTAGHALTFIPVHAELTTQQAADLLNVSRPFLVNLIEERRIPCRKIGTHRRILFEDVMRYKQQMDVDRRAVLDKFTREAQKLKMGYWRTPQETDIYVR